MPAYRDITDGEADIIAADDQVTICVEGRLQAIFSAEDLWFARIKLGSNGGEYAYQSICVPLRTVKLVLSEAVGCLSP
jgi:hypothetical protein